MEQSVCATEAALELLSKEELLEKCKSLISLVGQCERAKDELTQENNAMKEAVTNGLIQKEADKKDLSTMQELLQQFTEQKLAMSTELNELQLKQKTLNQQITQKDIENESLQRQLARMTEENDTLLNDIECIEAKLQQMDVLSKEQRQHLKTLEKQINNMKEMESHNASLLSQNRLLQEQQKLTEAKCITAINSLEEISKKYEINAQVHAQERFKYKDLKASFIEVHQQLKKLKKCKNALLVEQREYAREISLWQKEIINAAQKLCVHNTSLKLENERLSQQYKEKVQVNEPLDLSIQLVELHRLCEAVKAEHEDTIHLWQEAKKENIILKEQLAATKTSDEQSELSKKIQYIESLESEIVRIKAQFTEEAATEGTLEPEEKDLLVRLTEVEKICMEKSLENGKLRTALEETHDALEKIEQENIALLEQIQCQPVQEKWFDEIETQIESDTYEGNKQYLLNVLQDKFEQTNIKQPKQIEVLEKEQSLQNNMQPKSTEEIQEYLLHDKERNELRNKFEYLQQAKLTVENQHKAKIDELTNECNNLKKQLEEKLNLVTTESVEKQQIDERSDELIKLRHKYEDLYANFESKQRDHANLLDEMRELNEALKERGDTISRLQESQQELLCQLKRNNTKLQETEKLLEERQQQLVLLEEQRLSKQEQVPAVVEDMQVVKTTGDTEETIKRETDESFEEKYNKLRALAMKLKKKIQEQNTHINALEEQLQEKQHQFDIIKIDNQKLKSSRKQANVLNLEIEAAEKTLKENSEKLTAKTQELAIMSEQLNQQKQRLKQLEEEKAILETEKAEELANNKDLKKQVNLLQIQIKNAVTEQEKTLMNNKKLEEKMKEHQLKLDGMNLEFKSNIEKQNVEMEKAQNQLMQQERENLQLLEEFKSMQLQQKNTTQQLADLRADYAEYKLKAQTVLRKQQSAQESIRLPELHEEFKNLQQKHEQLEVQLAEREQNCAELKKQLVMLTDDYEHMQQRNKDLSNLLADAKQHNEAISAQYRQQALQQQQNLQAQRLQIEQMQVSHQQQLNELHIKLQQHMQQKVEKDITYSKPSKIDFFLMEREAAEGSEEADLNTLAANRKISVTSRPSQHEFMPLDELLNAPLSAMSDSVNTSGTAMERSYSGMDNRSNELVPSLELLQKQERQVRHLTALLAESEQDLAKLSQMNDMLKEELRRQERSVGREEHMHNSEYLKNVIIKFLTLNQNDERVRLVPVLNTILKLSRSEVELLNNVAKGQLSSGNAWSSFLPWSGGNH